VIYWAMYFIEGIHNGSLGSSNIIIG